jgi:hypothetical protein
MYVTNRSGAWQMTTVDSQGDLGGDGSIAVDAKGNVHISYLDNTNLDLKYATNVSGSWVTTTVDSQGNVGWNTALVADANGNVHISYSDPSPILNPPGNGWLKYATNKLGSWNVLIVDKENAGLTTSIAIDRQGFVHIAYAIVSQGAGKLKYTNNASGNWVSHIVDGAAGTSVGLFGWLVLDARGMPHISYYDYLNGDLKYAKKRE